MDYILVWNGVNGRVLSQNYIFDINEKPEIGFDYDVIFYESEIGNKFYYSNGQREITKELTPEQIQMCQNYCNNFIEVMDYPVQAYRDDLVYIGTMPKTEANKEGYGYIIANGEVPYAFCKLEDNRWQPIYCALEETGRPTFNPAQDDPAYVQLLTLTEYKSLPERTSPVYWFDFSTNTWKDKRNVERTKFNARQEIRAYFDHYNMRSEEFSGRIPAFEMATWSIQKQEAENYLKDETSNTPFIDACLKQIKSISVTKKEFCERILKHYRDDIFIKQGKLHGMMYDYLYRVELAETNAEIDNIVNEVYKKIGNGVIVNAYSKFPPTVQAVAGDKSVVFSDNKLFHTNYTGE